MSVLVTDNSTNCDHVLREGKGCNLGEGSLLYFYGPSQQLSLLFMILQV